MMIGSVASRSICGAPIGRCWGQWATSRSPLLREPARRSLLLNRLTVATRPMSSYKDRWTWQEVRIPTPCGSLAAKAWGPIDGKPILTLHGWQDNANSFDLLIPLLQPNYRIIALDFMGHGYSSHIPPGQFYSPNTFILDVQRVADYYDWEKFTIIGHSMGGGIGHMYSMLFPERLNKLITIDVPLPPTMKVDKFVMMTVFATLNLLRIEREHFGDRPFTYPASVIIEKHMAAIKNAYTEEALRVLMKRGCTQIGSDEFVFNRDRRLKYMYWNSFDLDTSEQLAARYQNELLAIRCLPLQFVREGYFKLQEVHKKHCSRYEYVEVEGLHHVHMTDPTKVAPIIDNFLAKSSHEDG